MLAGAACGVPTASGELDRGISITQYQKGDIVTSIQYLEPWVDTLIVEGAVDAAPLELALDHVALAVPSKVDDRACRLSKATSTIKRTTTVILST